MINKYIILIVLHCSLLSFSLLADEKNQQGIEVVGYGMVEVNADVFSVQITLKERNISATKSQQLVEYKMQLITDVAKSFTNKRSDIHLQAINSKAIELDPSITVNGVISKQKFANGGQGKVFVSTNNLNQASNQLINTNKIVIETSQKVIVKLSSLSQYSQFIDSIIKVGVSYISPVESSFSQKETSYQQALDLAMENAHKKAKKLADVMQVTLGRLTFIKENKISNNRQDKMSASTHSLLIEAEIIARFAIEN